MAIYSFPPIINDDAEILILGSMPGEESLRLNQYYAHRRNSFWPIMFTLFDQEFSEDYSDRVNLLLNHKIGLWDVLASCDREGSLDSKIKNEQINDFKALFSRYLNIKVVLFNGAKARQSFKRHVKLSGQEDLVFYQMPSTSPAHAIPFEQKLDQWSIIKTL